MDAPTERKITEYGRNIYNDSFDKFTGLFRYTGEGQRGPQKFKRGNKSLKYAKRNDTKIHFFMQKWPFLKIQVHLKSTNPRTNPDTRQEDAG